MKVAAATSCSNEGRYLLEWVAHLMVMGVTRFFIFTHNNVEDQVFLDAKATLEATGMVTFHESIRTGENRCFQMENFCRARDFGRAEGFDWLWCADLDEYLILSSASTIPDFLGGVKSQVSQVSFNWLIYGSSEETEYDPDRLHLERFTRHGLLDFGEHIYVKSLVRLAHAKKMHLHLHDVKGATAGSSRNNTRITGPCSTEIDLLGGFCFHASIRSRGEFVEKQTRGYASEVHTTKINEQYWSVRDRNELVGPKCTTQIAFTRLILDQWKQGISQPIIIPNPNYHENQIPQHESWPRNRTARNLAPCS